MEPVRKARHRLSNYPALLTKCSVQGAAYAACVTQDFNVKQGTCEKEFVVFKECLKKAAVEMKTKL